MLLANRFASTQGIVLEWIYQFYERILTLRASHVTQPLSARAAFPKGNRSMTMRDVLGILYSEQHLQSLRRNNLEGHSYTAVAMAYGPVPFHLKFWSSCLQYGGSHRGCLASRLLRVTRSP